MRQLHKFFSLTSNERKLLINAFLLLIYIRLGLWLLPFHILQKTIRKIEPSLLKYSEVSQLSVAQIIWAVELSCQYLPGKVKCLAKALITQVLMNHLGYLSQLYIGVAKGKQNQLEAHAWVKYQEQIVMGYLYDLSRFIPLPSLLKF